MARPDGQQIRPEDDRLATHVVTAPNFSDLLDLCLLREDPRSKAHGGQTTVQAEKSFDRVQLPASPAQCLALL
jgi:hypothetical protein